MDCSLEDDLDGSNDQQDSEIELFVNNVVCTFALSCKLNLRKIAMEAANVIYKRDHAVRITLTSIDRHRSFSS